MVAAHYGPACGVEQESNAGNPVGALATKRQSAKEFEHRSERTEAWGGSEPQVSSTERSPELGSFKSEELQIFCKGLAAERDAMQAEVVRCRASGQHMTRQCEGLVAECKSLNADAHQAARDLEDTCRQFTEMRSSLLALCAELRSQNEELGRQSRSVMAPCATCEHLRGRCDELAALCRGRFCLPADSVICSAQRGSAFVASRSPDIGM